MSDESVDSGALPAPVCEAAQRLAQLVEEHLGTLSGQTALYWRLLHVIRQHARKEI